MKKSSRLLSFVLAILMIVGLLPINSFTAFAEDTEPYPIPLNGLTFTTVTGGG